MDLTKKDWFKHADRVKYKDDSRRNNSTEPGAHDLNPSIRFSACLLDLVADVFAFPVTICPNHERIGTSSFLSEILLYFLRVLSRIETIEDALSVLGV